MEAPAECTPVPCNDPDEAASVWRAEKLRDFEWRLRCLGVKDDPGFAVLLAQISEHTAALEQLAERQRQPDYERPWWADGEYDGGRADSANDEGLRLLAAGRLSEAFDCFTEAIRLRPTSPVYHCNRAAVCLKLKRADLASEDAANAIQRDPWYLRAYLRGGRAHLQLQQPAEAQALFKRALELDGSSAAARQGLAQAEALQQQQGAQQQQEAAAARAGSRPGMSRDAVPEAEAAQQLYSAAQMLAANPRLHAARCAHVEGLIACQRYTEATAECEGLLDGSDRLYLQAEVAWRQGELASALSLLDEALAVASGCTKCSDLRAFVGRLEALWQEAGLAREDGALTRCLDLSGELLAAVAPAACTGLCCAVRYLRAEAYAARGLWSDAVAELNAALEGVDCAHAPCLLLRAEAHQQLGARMEAVLDLQRLQKVAPGTPGLFAMLERAARLCLGGKQQRGQGQQRGFWDSGGIDGEEPSCSRGGGGSVGEALAALGLGSGATSAQIRQAYLKLAARWHPDKWAGASDAERGAAEARFKVIQQAYEALAE